MVEAVKDPPKIAEGASSGQKIAGGGGGDVYAGAPLVRGIPVVVPVNDELAEEIDAELVMGVALAAPVVEGVPEMIANAQAEVSLEATDDKPGDVKGFSFSNGEVLVAIIDEDGQKEDIRFPASEEDYAEFEESFQDQKNWKKNAKTAFNKLFKNKDMHPEDKRRLEGKRKAEKAAKAANK